MTDEGEAEAMAMAQARERVADERDRVADDRAFEASTGANRSPSRPRTSVGTRTASRMGRTSMSDHASRSIHAIVGLAEVR